MPNNSDGSRLGWQIIDDDSFELALAGFQDTQGIDDAIAPVLFSLHGNPSAWPEVPGFPGIHIAKTKLHLSEAEIVPSYALWFRAYDDRREVHLLWLEITRPDEFGFPDGEDNIDLPF